MKLSEYFSASECACKGDNCCGGSYPMDEYFIAIMDVIRNESGGPLIVNSGFRCKVHNDAVGGVKNSWHTRGQAMDVVPASCSLSELRKVAEKYCTEVIQYDNFLHIARPKMNI